MTEPNRVWLVRYSEVFLKSEPVRRAWEKSLVCGIEQSAPGCKVRRSAGGSRLPGTSTRRCSGYLWHRLVLALRCRAARRSAGGASRFCDDHDIEDAATFALRIRRVRTHRFTSQDLARRLGDLVRSDTRTFRSTSITQNGGDLYRGRDGAPATSSTEDPGGIPPGWRTLVALISGGIGSRSRPT